MTEISKPNIQRQLNNGIDKTPALQMKLWQRQPIIFFRDCFDALLDDWQEEVTDLYLHNQRIGLLASKGPGKTFILGLCGWHFFLTKKTPKIACLSISEANLKSNLWAELLMLRSKSKLATKSTTDGSEKIKLIGSEGFSFFQARSYPKSADEQMMASVLAGIHADNVMFLIDEGGTIPDAIYNTADAALSTGNENGKSAKLMTAANTEQPSGVLYRASMGKTIQKWAIYHISGDPDDPKRAPRVDINWAREQIAEYGRDNPWVMVNVLAKYPQVSSDVLLTEQEIFESMKRDIDEREVRNAQPRLGVDVARGGIDNTAFARRRGLKAYPIEGVTSEMRGPELAGKILFIEREEKVEKIYVDDTGGYGSSVMDSLHMHPHIDVIGIKYNARAQDKKRYFNKRTEMWVRMRDWVRKGGCLPNDPDLANQLSMPKLYFHGGVLRLEEKEQIKARLGKSPDKADALAQTFADPEEPSFYADYSNNYSHVPGHPHNQQGKYYSDESQLDDKYENSTNYKA